MDEPLVAATFLYTMLFDFIVMLLRSDTIQGCHGTAMSASLTPSGMQRLEASLLNRQDGLPAHQPAVQGRALLLLNCVI
jgi:hypothetical protein